MNIKEALHRGRLAGAALAAAAMLLAGVAHADVPAPGAINDLTATGGSQNGSVRLQWTARGDDGGTEPATKQVVKYRFNNKILTENDWDAAFRVDEPPVNVSVSSPSANSVIEQLNVTGLEPGVVYGFAVRTYDEDGLISSLGLSATAQATAPCGRDPNDGLGVASVIVQPTSQFAGDLFIATVSIGINGNGILTGGKIALQVPYFFNRPTLTPGQAGFVTATNSLGGAGLSLVVDGQTAILHVTSGSINSGDIVKFYYTAQTCSANTGLFRVFTQYKDCGVLSDTVIGGPIIINPGNSRFIDFEYYDVTAVVNQVVPVNLRVIDSCGNTVPLSVSTTVVVSAINMVANVPLPDPSARVSLSPGFASPALSVSVSLIGTSTGAVVYYRVPDTSNKPNNRIKIHQVDLLNPNFFTDRFAFVRPIATGITNSTIDTGIPVAGQKSVTFSPDNDGVADTANINFTLPEDMGWSVEISSNGFSSVARRFFGFGTSGRVSWDGYAEGAPGVPPAIAANGAYAVRILVPGSNLVDTTLTATVNTLGVNGFVMDTSSVSLSNVDVEIYGPTNRYARTDALGAYKVDGLKAGTYQVRYRKTGYSFKEITVTVATANQVLSNVFLSRESILRLIVTRPVSDRMEEVWGSVRANNADWSKQAFGTVHFGRGKERADAGDLYNVEATSHTALTLAPNVAYRLHFEVPNLSTTDFNVTLAVGADQFYPVLLQSRANIEGKVEIPAGTNPSGMWISVEAGPDANLDQVIDNQDPSKRYWGGAWLAPNEVSGIYRLFGVNNGSYTVVATAPGFIQQRRTIVVSNDQNATADFSTFSVGGTIVTSITVHGDTTVLDSQDGQNDGFFSVPINAWSSALQTGSFTQVRIPENATVTSASFTLTGLSDGVYDVFANVRGFELDPPGRRLVNVTGGAASLGLTFKGYTGVLSGAITLPAGATNYDDVEISLSAYDWNLGNYSEPPIAGNVYTFSNLGTGFYALRARYPDSGFIAEKSVQIVNGRPATIDLDLSGATYDISGRVTTTASAPFNRVDYIVSNSTPTTLYDKAAGGNVVVAANRIVAERIDRQDRGGDNQNQPANAFDSRTTFFGTYNANGDFTIANLTPGSYRIRNNGELDNDFTDGREVAESLRIVKILTGDATGQDLEITDGYDVSGTVTLKDESEPVGRNLVLSLQNASRETVAQTQVFLASRTVSFSMERIPSGDYILSTNDNLSPKAYAAKDVRVIVDGADETDVSVELLKAAQIRGRLRIKSSGILLTSRNYSQFLSSQFSVEARANPWFNGGYHRFQEPIVNADGYFVIPTNPGKFDVHFRVQQSLSPEEISQGKKQLVPLQISGITVEAGRIFDLGVVELIEGTTITGTVRDASGNPVPNIIVVAYPSSGRNNYEPLQTFTNELGQYTIQGVDSENVRFYDVIAAPRPQGDERFNGFAGTRYGEVRRTQIDTRLGAPVNFVVDVALGVVTGRVVTPDGGDLETPFNHDQKPGGVVIMNRVGTIPSDNPLGNIEENTDAEGNFKVAGLAPGTYSLWALGKGYGNGFVRNITVGNGTTPIGDVELRAGFKLSGAVLRPDGTAPNSSEVDTLVGVRSGFEEVLIGQFVTDAAGTILSYEISGFQAGKAYTILAFNESNDVLVLADGVILTADAKRDFTLTDKSPSILAQVNKANDGSVIVQFEFTKALRNDVTDLDDNGIADDSDPEKIITLKVGASTPTFDANWLSGDRKRAKVTYMPAAGEQRFTLTVNAAFDVQDTATGQSFTVTKDFPIFLGIGKQKSQKFSNAGGGAVQLDEDTSEFSSQAGTFGANADDTVDVVFRAADQADNFDAAPGLSGAATMKLASDLGLAAYPAGIAGAINRLRSADVDPFSSFYDIFLPAGVNHFFPEGKEARLCLAYDSSVSDPAGLNVYYFNEATNEYLLESENKTVDTDNQRICVSLSHASVFTVLNSSAPIISGGGYAGELNVVNFPNPFNLKAKTVTLQNPGSASASQSINGTMIKISAPVDVAGAVEIQIFGVSGEKVRTLHGAIPTGGAHYYIEWDGTNDSGAKVASGTYVARMTVGGGNEKFFKMAVLK